MKRFFRPLVLLLLAGMVALSPLCGLAQEVAAEEEAPITHTAIASVALKVRRSPSKDASAGDSIPRDSFVYILELGEEWRKVRTTRAATPYELKNKLIRYGLAQGYDYEAVRDAADALIATTDDSCDTFF